MSSESFADLGVSRPVLGALAERGIKEPFAVQRLCVADVLAGEDVLVQSPTGSGKTFAFGIPMVEAFACGTPVVSSAGGSLPEVSGGAAEIVDGFEPAEWASTISAVLDDSSKLSQMRERGFARSKDFSWEDTARITSDVYCEVVRGR